ncbi:DUF2628 domain-containing protein [Sulfurimonas sp. HSL-3221]|uniref:DUF2628 domain-containing protein n=1 Tax=Sulfurimonadaceae TaxID=2771471 RepID=UPI001E60736C|nr:DUF2628 domain-containing protein [Sulfurimonas sp. HSL-3221]UFS61625.1 DUF2628 domain-containing protein [Sulfurimonas sp. HSL-3221]
MENQPYMDVATVEEVPTESKEEHAPGIHYDDAMLGAFVQKPEKFAWYKRTFAKFNRNGVDGFAWSWSWWAFFVTFWFLLYRKAYLAAIGYFGAALLFSFLSLGLIGTLIFMIIAGGTAPYFVYKNYRDLQRRAEAVSTDTEVRIATMRQLGGYHTWVVVVAAIINTLLLIGVLLGFVALGVVLTSTSQG